MSVCVKFSHLVETLETILLTQWDKLDFVELVSRGNVHEGFCSFGNSKDITGHNVSILVHTNDRFDLVSWGKASVTHTEDVLQKNWVLWFVTVNEWMRICNLALAVDKNLSRSFVKARSILVLHKVSWCGEFETHAVDNAIVLLVLWAAFFVSGTGENCNAKLFKNWHNCFVTTLELWEQFWTRTAD